METGKGAGRVLTGRPRLLIADDDKLMRNRLKMMLAQMPVDIVGEATDGSEAISMAEELKPDIITMDLIMPGVDGLKAIREIKIKQPHIAIIVVSSLSKINVIQECIKAGASTFVIKPFDQTKVANTINSVIRKLSGEAQPSEDAAARIFDSENGQKKLRVLIVEDDRMTRLTLKKILLKAGHDVVGEAENGYKAIELAKSLVPDLITMDLIMRDMDGLKATREIKKTMPDMKIIVVSGVAKMNVVSECIKAGAATYIIKPFEYRKVINAINLTFAVVPGSEEEKLTLARDAVVAGSENVRIDLLKIACVHATGADDPEHDFARIHQQFTRLIKNAGAQLVDINATPDVTVDSTFSLLHVFGLSDDNYIVCRQAVENKVPVIVTPLYWNDEYPIYFDLTGAPVSGDEPPVKEHKLDPAFYERRLSLRKLRKRKYMLDRATYVHVNGECERALVCRDFDVKPTRTVKFFFGADPVYDPIKSSISEISSKLDAGFDILCLGPLDEKNNQHMVIEATRELGMKVVISSCSLNDPDPSNHYVNFCCELAHDDVIFVPQVPPQLREGLFARAKVLVVPSFNESSCINCLEAIAAGCPVVVTERGNAWDYFGDMVEYCNPESDSSIASAISRAIECGVTDSLREKVNGFKWGNSSEELFRIYRNSVTVFAARQEDPAS